MTKRILSLVMVLCMMLTMVPAFADTTCTHPAEKLIYKAADLAKHSIRCECGNYYGSGEHEYAYDENGWGSCKFCGLEKTTVGCGAHTYAKDLYKVDGDFHYAVCDVCGLVDEASKAAHDYTIDKSFSADQCVCGAEEVCENHDPKWIVYNSDETKCVKFCANCGTYVEGPAAHVYSIADNGGKIGEDGYHDYTCVNCGYTKSEYHYSHLVQENGAAKWFTDGEYHWNVCEECDAIVNKTAHDFWWANNTETTDDTNDLVYICGTCKLVAAECKEHVTTDAVNGATCQKLAICDNCGLEYGSKAPCNWGALANFGAQHGYACTICGARKNLTAHEYILVGSDAICACGAKVVCEHEWETVPAVPTSCTAADDGATEGSKCSVCGTWQVKPTTIKKGHTWLKEIYIEATCLKDGTMKKTCTVCGAIEFDPIDRTTSDLAHDLVFDKVTKKANCTEKGEEQWKCSNKACTYTTTKEIPALGHVTKQIKVDYVNGKLTDKLSCEGGIYSYTGCENCSYMLSEIKLIPNSEYAKHSFQYVGKVAGNCTAPEGYLYACTNNDCEVTVLCDVDGKELDLTGYDKYHNVGGKVIEHITPATCTTDGSKWYQCPACGEQIAPEGRVAGTAGNWVTSKKVFEIKSAGHTNKGAVDATWKITPATCQEFGYAESTCSVCGGNYRKVVTSYTFAPCSFVKGKALTEEVCGKTADYESVCKWCGALEMSADGKQQIIKEEQAVDHKWVMDGEIITAGKTCQDSDYAAAVCARCGKKDAYHEFKNTDAKCDFVTMIVPATCTEGTKEGSYCAICGKKNPAVAETEKEDELGHAMDAGEMITYCGQKNLIKFSCTRCDFVEYKLNGTTAFVPSTAGHKATSVKPLVLVEATCETEGLRMKSYCADCGFIFDSEIEKYGGEHVAKDDTYKTYTDCTGTYETFVCKNCTLKIDRKLPGDAGKVVDKTAHRAPVYELITPFTCTESGFGYEACTACGYKASKPATIPAQHVWAEELVVVEEADCANAGKGKKVCTVCGQEETVNGKVVYYPIKATGKHNFVEYILESGICSEKSYVIYECSVCEGKADAKTLAKAGYTGYITNAVFNWLNPVTNRVENNDAAAVNAVEVVNFTGECDFGTPVKVAATCTDPAGVAQTCKVCGYVKVTGTGAALGHDEVKTTVKATCYLAGVETTTCYRCGLVVEEKEIPATEHKMAVVKNDVRNVAATCSTTGIEVSACEYCGYEELNATAKVAKNHKYEAIKVYTAADCKTGTSGLVNEKCVLCGASGVHTVAPEHKYVDTAVKQAAKCDVAGIMIQTCSVCEKATREVSIPKTAHVMITKEQAADCNNAAGIVTCCANCDLVTSFQKTGSAKLGHKWSAKVWVAPTCTSAGGYQITCLREGCGEVVFEESKAVADAALNHKGATLVEKIAATCKTPAYEIYSCPICKTEITKIAGPIDLTKGHAWEITAYYNYEPTCKKAGFVDRKCALCGATGTRVWHTPEHEYVEVISNGCIYDLCMGCGDIKTIYVSESFAGFNGCTTVSVDAKGNKILVGAHKGLVVKVGKEATCTEAGQVEDIRCTVCGTVIADGAVIPAHTVTEIAAVAPTCTTAGSTAGKYCEVCKEYLVKVEEVAALGHKEVKVPAVDATATAPGATEGTKCETCGEWIVEPTVVPQKGATVKRLCVVRSKAADYREDATSEVVKMLAEGTAVVITGELVNEYYPVEGGYIHMSYITVA